MSKIAIELAKETENDIGRAYPLKNQHLRKEERTHEH
jgi:hypothetical protein